jgi:hypothetical protein
MTRRVAKFPRDFKFLLGDRILGNVYELLDLLIRRFLEPLRLCLHPRKCVILPVRLDVPFLGWRVFADHRRLRRSTGVRFQRRLKELAAAYRRGEVDLAEVRASLASWNGHLKHGDTWGLRSRLLRATVFVRQPFQADPGQANPRVRQPFQADTAHSRQAGEPDVPQGATHGKNR